MFDTVEEIGPTLAAAYLEKNTHNRPLRQSHVAALSAAIRRGEWVLTHESIAFDVDDRLIDGQHRLRAIVDSGVACRLKVSRGCDRDSFMVIGSGRPRAASDALSLDGEKNGRSIAAIVRVIIGGKTNTHNGNNGSASAVAVIGFMQSSPYADLVRMSAEKNVHSIVAGVFIRAVIAGKIKAQKALDALTVYQDQSWNGAGDTMRILRRAVERARRDRGLIYGYAVRAVRAVARGETIGKLYAADEDFDLVGKI